MRESPYRTNRRIAAHAMGTLLVTVAAIALISAAASGDWLRTLRRSIALPTIQARPTVKPTEDLSLLTDSALEKRARIVTFAELARNPHIYEGDLVRVRGSVMQIIGSGWNGTEMLVAITPERIGDSTLWDDPVYVRAKRAPNLLEDDEIVVYGVAQGLYSYQTVLRAERTVPYIDAVRILIARARN